MRRDFVEKLTVLAIVMFVVPGHAQVNENQASERSPRAHAFNAATFQKLEEIQLVAFDAIKADPRDALISKDQWQEISTALSRRGGLSTDNPETMADFYDRAVSRPQPTPYQDPMQYFLLMNRAAEIGEMSQWLDFEVDRSLLFGTSPLGQINAVTVPIEKVNSEAVIVVDQGLFTAAWLNAKVIAQATAQEDREQDNLTFTTDPEQVGKNINSNSKIAGAFIDFLFAYIRDGSPGSAREYTLPAAHNLEAIGLTRSIEFFVVGHEYGHVIGKHLDDYPRTVAFRGDKDTQEIWFDQLQEFEADIYGFQLSRLAVLKYDGDLALGLAGPTILFVVEEIVCEALGVLTSGQSKDYPTTLSHPPPMQRLDLLRSFVRDKGGDTAPAALEVSANLEDLIKLLWRERRSIFETGNSVGLKPAPVWISSKLATECAAD